MSLKKKTSGTVPQVSSNNVGGTQSFPHTNCGTAPDPVGSPHHMVASVIPSNYAVQTKSVCEQHNNDISDPELCLFIAELQKAWNLNQVDILYAICFTIYVTL